LFNTWSTRSTFISALSFGPQPVFASSVVVPWRAMASSQTRPRAASRCAVMATKPLAARSMSISAAGVESPACGCGNIKWV
jgi:hypothetical protein